MRERRHRPERATADEVASAVEPKSNGVGTSLEPSFCLPLSLDPHSCGKANRTLFVPNKTYFVVAAMIRSQHMLRQAVCNPYLAYFFSLPVGCIRDPTVPLSDDLELRMPDWLAFKLPIVTRFSWAVPTQHAVDAIARLTSKVIEIGAGSGYWAWLLSQAGVAVTAYDCAPRADTWYPICPGNEFSILGHRDATLFLCWPPAGTDMAFNTLRNYPGDYVIYVGEWLRGNADIKFFNLLARAFEEVETVSIPQWFMRTDGLSIHKRRR